MNDLNIDFKKSLFTFISIPHSDIKSGDELSGNLVNLADLILLLQHPPFEIPKDNLLKFLYPKSADDIYDTIKSRITSDEIEHLFIFYQGFGLEKDGQLMLSLSQKYASSDDNYLSISRLSNIVSQREDLNVVFSIDSSYSAIAFNDFTSPNHVLISSCGEAQQAYVRKIAEKNQHISIFSYALANTFKAISTGELSDISIYDLFTHIEERMEPYLKMRSGKRLSQAPEISMRNHTLALKIAGKPTIPEVKEAPTIDFDALKLLVASNEHLKVFDFFEQQDILDDMDENTIFLLKSQYTKIRREEALGLITDNDFDVATNKITYALLSSIDAFSERYG